MSGWRVIATRACGCEIIQLDAPDLPNHGEVSLRHTWLCVYHLCRLCGAVPLADAEPDVLCDECWNLPAAASETNGEPSPASTSSLRRDAVP